MSINIICCCNGANYRNRQLIKFRTDFNSCKTVACKNFGVLGSKDYVYQSLRLGYLSVECKACGSNPPWVNNALVATTLNEKLTYQLGRKISACPFCNDYFFVARKEKSIRHGFTSAGIQRQKCNHCHAIFTLPQDKNRDRYKLLLETILSAKSRHEAINVSGLSARLYYFYLNKLVFC